MRQSTVARGTGPPDLRPLDRLYAAAGLAAFVILRQPYRPESYWSERLRDGFDLRSTGHLEYSPGYNKWLYRAKRRALDAALTDVPRGTVALDVGSGVGWVVRQLLDRGLRVEGCDIAPIAVDKLERRFPEATFFPLAFGSVPVPRDDASYGLITALDVTYHVTEDALWLAGMSELARVLAPGGLVVVSDGMGRADDEPAPHVRFRSRGTWSQVEELGLTIQEVHPYFRWLSRPRDSRFFRHLNDGLRGGLEFALERVAPRKPHMRWAILERA
jgi:SAM-dependent methyltransferase